MSNYIPSITTVAKGAFASAVGFGTLGISLLYYGQNYLIYPSAFPPGSRSEVPVPSDFGLVYEEVVLETSDHIKIRAFVMVQKVNIEHATPVHVEGSSQPTDDEFASSRPTVLMFHGNGGNAGHRIPLAKVFYLRMRCNVIMLSYRGYGHSEGAPSERGIRIDSQAVLDYVKASPVLSPSPVILYGQSIGGAVSIDLASRNPSKIRAMILENTFLSLPRLIPTALPLLSPFSFLCHQKWDSASKLPLLPPDLPTLMLAGAMDEVVPNEHMRELERLLRKPSGKPERPGKYVEFASGKHNDTCIQSGYWHAVADFVRDLQ